MISLVLFDLDDTLFAHRRAVEEGVIAHLRALPGLRTRDPSDRGRALDDARRAALYALSRGRARLPRSAACPSPGLHGPYGVSFADDRAAQVWFEEYLTHYRAAWTLHDDALPALDALASRRLGIITNGVAHFQQPKLDILALTARFEHVVMSGDFGAVKPDPSIFLHACRVFDVPPASAAYVGDRLRTDAIGAASAGLTGIWLNRSGATSESDAGAISASGVQVISTLAELPSLLDRL